MRNDAVLELAGQAMVRQGVPMMRRGAVVMQVSRAMLVVTVALATLLGPVAPVARAQDAVDEGSASETGWDWESSDSGDDIERWWGALGAVLCGAEVRLVRVAPAIGMNPYAIAAGVGGCVLAAMDVLTTQ